MEELKPSESFAAALSCVPSGLCCTSSSLSGRRLLSQRADSQVWSR